MRKIVPTTAKSKDQGFGDECPGFSFCPVPPAPGGRRASLKFFSSCLHDVLIFSSWIATRTAADISGRSLFFGRDWSGGAAAWHGPSVPPDRGKEGDITGTGTPGLPRPRGPYRPEIRNTTARSRGSLGDRQDGAHLVPAPAGRKKADVVTSAFVISILEYRSRCRCIAPFGVISEQPPYGGEAPSRSSD